MKKFSSILSYVGVFVMMSFVLTISCLASSASFGFEGPSSTEVGKEITLSLYISDVSSGAKIVSGEGNLSIDGELFEYVTGAGASSSPYSFAINPNNNYKFAGIDTSMEMEGIQSKTTILTFTLKAIKEGSATITITNPKMSDSGTKIVPTVLNKTITIGASKTLSSDATLKALEVSGYTMSPSFSSSKTEYTVTVPSDATSITITGSANDESATVEGLGNVSLTGETTTKEIKVKAEDGTEKTYKITIKKETSSDTSLDGDATLKSLDVSGYTLYPTFNSSTTAYTIYVASTVDGLNLKAVPNSSKATYKASGNLGWKDGVNTITITVTAQNGTTKIYTVNAVRGKVDTAGSGDTASEGKNDTTLKSLTIKSTHTMEPSFSSSVKSYSVTVPYEVSSLDMTWVTNSTGAKVSVSGNDSFAVGKSSTVILTVTAEDGSVDYYVLNVTRNSKTSDTNLKNLSIKGYELSPQFDPDVTDYKTTIDSKTNSLNITALAEQTGAKVEIIGNDNLKEGHNTILIKVTDKDGMTKYYTIDAYKEASTSKGFLGLSTNTWLIIFGIFGFLLLLWLLLLLFMRRNKERVKQKNAPVIEFKPEFNFGSKNTSDDDVVHGNFNQESDISYAPSDEANMIEADAKEVMLDEFEDDDECEDTDEVPFDPYDATITKDELVAAIHEAVRTDDASKLKMLLDQDELNQRKKKMKQEEQERKEYYE